MNDKEFFDWLKTKQSDGKLSQVQVDGMAELLTVVKPLVLKDSLSKLNGWTDVVITPVPEGYVSANFTMRELTHSNTAVARKIDNVPKGVHRTNLVEATTNLFQPVREALGYPMIISSGYRSPAVNKAVGGSNTSAHSVGFAIDFKCPKFGNPIKIAEFLVKYLYVNKIKFDQLILEFPNTGSTWVHLGYKSPKGSQRMQVLTAKKVNGRTTYLNGLKY